MKGAAGHTVRGPLHRQWDLERTHAKQAEARLSQHLQSLERARLCRLRLLAWEQRQLQRQLQRLQTGNREGRAGPGHTAQGRPSQLLEHPDPDLRLRPGPPTTPPTPFPPPSFNSLLHQPLFPTLSLSACRGKCASSSSSSSGHGAPQRPGGAPVRPQQGGDLRAPRAPGARAPATNAAQEAPGAWPRASFRPDSLEGPVGSQEQSPPLSHVTSHLTRETPPDQAVSPGSPAPGPEASRAGDGGGALGEASPEAKGSQSGLSAGEYAPPGAPSYREVLARAANAHYLRHRAPLEAERLLSLREIFGHGGHSPALPSPQSTASAPGETCAVLFPAVSPFPDLPGQSKKSEGGVSENQ
ncbi:coiled-coil domain-containing protein 190 [Pipistrellus kuhlii]|uniref:coiled-coil domain-containing protein 190 n=1 Tax=Pipistrellus kuhlii TaxID=59472 RepID=UPI001E274BAB|nr:coiled-coil domain-containing protein 190 [Pipistrellus kuhlii]